MAYKINKTEFRVLHTADWHVCTEFLDDAKRCLDFMIKHVRNLDKPLDLIVIPGDIYNHRQIRQESEAARLAFETVQVLSTFAPTIVMTGTPSHDGNAPLMLEIIGRDFIRVADKPSQFVVYAGGQYLPEISPIDKKSPATPVAIVSCAPAFTKQHFESLSDVQTSDNEIAAALGGIFSNFGMKANEFQRANREHGPLPHILLGHWQVGGAFVHPSQNIVGRDIEVSMGHIHMANASITCLGHLHAEQKIGDNTFYSGSLFATDFGEFEEKGFYIHTLDLVDMGHHWEPHWMDFDTGFVRTPSPTLVKINIDLILNPFEEKELMLQYILSRAAKNDHLSMLREDDGWNTILRMEIKTYQDESGYIDEDAIDEYFEELGLRSFDLTVIRIPRPNVRSAQIMEADRLREKVEVRAKIVDHTLHPGMMEKADLLQDKEPEILSEIINLHIEREKRKYEDTTY